MTHPLHSPHGRDDGASPPPFFVLLSHSCTPMSGVRVRGLGSGVRASHQADEGSIAVGKPQILQSPGYGCERPGERRRRGA